MISVRRRYTNMVIPGVEEADRLNLEAFIEATDLGKLTYEACGFVYAGTNYLESAKRNASLEWRDLERDMGYVYFSICEWSYILDIRVAGCALLVFLEPPFVDSFARSWKNETRCD